MGWRARGGECERRFVSASRVAERHRGSRGIRAALVCRRADVAGPAVCARLQVADQVVMGEGQHGERKNVRHRDQLHQNAQLMPGKSHDSIIPVAGSGMRMEARCDLRFAVRGLQLLTANC
jgi:hypothetical protein